MAHKHGDRAGNPPPSSLRDVERPRGATWRTLQADGIDWEGQVLIVGADLDLAARLVLTRQRLALIRGGQIALDLPRAWLHPAPEMLAENGIRVSITPDEPGGEADTLVLRARDGRGSAAQIVAVLSGRPLSWQAPPPALSAGRSMWDDEPEPAEPRWNQRIGASPAMALPPLPESTGEAPRGEPSAAELDAATFGPYDDTPRGRAAMTYRGRTSASISDWTSRYLDEQSAPAATGRPMRSVIVDDNGIYPADGPDDRIAPAPAAAEPSRGSRPLVWSLRIAILLILLGTATYFGRDRLPFALTIPDLPHRGAATKTATTGNDVSRLPAEQATNEMRAGGDNQVGSRQGSSTEPSATQSVTQARGTENPAGVGGTISDTAIAPPPSEQAAAQTDATEPPATRPPTVPPTTPAEANQPASAGSQNALAAVTEAPTRIPTEPATVAPTLAPTQPPPTEAPTQEPTIAPTSPPATVPSTQPATATPTTAPTKTAMPTAIATATSTPTKTAINVATATTPPPPATATATSASQTQAAPAKATATPTLEPQPASFGPDETPSQQAVSGSFRYSIEGMERGYTLPDLPEIANVGYGEWVVLAVYGQNWSAKDQVFDMSRFKMIADGQEIQIDTGNAWVAGLLGFKPAFGNSDAVLFAPKEGHRFALTFLIPAGTKQLTLVAGDQSFDLNVSAQTAPKLAALPSREPSPNLLAATVVKVVSADSIVVDVNGRQQQVRYLGIDVPDGTACYASEAAKANTGLVAGKTVYLERQSTNVDPHGTWVRDVWTMDRSGGYQLTATQLVAAGAAVADISRPNIQFADWLTSVQAKAKEGKKGLWAACGGLKSAASTSQERGAASATQVTAALPSQARGRTSTRRRRARGTTTA